MEAVYGIIVIERRGEDHYRASCPLFPDCEAVATTEAAARQAAAEAIGRILRERLESLIAGARAERDNTDV
jgi:predicted RNase H-like HicB family nuclease